MALKFDHAQPRMLGSFCSPDTTQFGSKLFRSPTSTVWLVPSRRSLSLTLLLTWKTPSQVALG
jgi:hypothetical protein